VRANRTRGATSLPPCHSRSTVCAVRMVECAELLAADLFT